MNKKINKDWPTAQETSSLTSLGLFFSSSSFWVVVVAILVVVVVIHIHIHVVGGVMEKREDAGGRVEVVMVWSWLSTKLSSPWLLYFGQSWGWVEVWVKVWIVVKFRAFKHETPTWTPTLAKLGNWEIELGLSWGTSWRLSWACLNAPNECLVNVKRYSVSIEKTLYI